MRKERRGTKHEQAEDPEWDAQGPKEPWSSGSRKGASWQRGPLGTARGNKDGKRESWPGNRRGCGELIRRMNLAPKHEYVTKGEEPTCEDHQPGKRGKNESRERTRAIRPRDRKEEG